MFYDPAMVLLPLLALVAQSPSQSPSQSLPRSGDRLPPANALSPGDDAPVAILAPLTAILAAGSADAVLAQTLPDGAATIVTEGASPVVRRLSWPEFAAQADARVQERLTDPAVEVDGDVATIWSPYVATRDNRTIRCGIDQASLVRSEGGWKVLTLTRSERTTGCAADSIRR